MKIKALLAITLFSGSMLVASCGNNQQNTDSQSVIDESSNLTAGQSGVVDDESQRNIVQVAVGSPDHSTLVAAVQTAGLVDVLTNAGPFTVFAPTNAAFDALPAGTVDNLLKPENLEQLQDILQYHVAVAVLKPELLMDGQKLEMVNGGFVTIKKDGDNIIVNDAKIVGNVTASNGLVYVVDKVILPQQ